MKQIVATVFLILCFTSLLFFLPTGAEGEVYVAAGNTVLPLSSAPPIHSSGVWYIDYQCFTKGNLKVNTVYNSADRTLILYTWDTTLFFDLNKTIAYETTEKIQYKAVSFTASGTVYVPVQFTAQMLGLEYSYSSDIPLIRIKRSSDIPNSMFLYLAKDEINNFQKQNEEKENSSTSKPVEDGTTQKPTAQPPVTQKPATSQTPTTQKPTTQPSVTQKPATQQTPTTQKPTAQPSVTQKPATQQTPTTQNPTAQPPVVTPPPQLQNNPQMPPLPNNEEKPQGPELSPRNIRLTFNITNGENIKSILNVLSQHNVKATFFIQGSAISSCEDELRRAVSAGHTLGTLSQNGDTDFISTPEELGAALNTFNERLFEITKTKTRLCRIPSGSKTLDTTKVDTLILLGYRIWDDDISPAGKSSAQVYNSTVSALEANKKNTLTLAFSENKPSVNSLPKILQYLKTNNYTAYPITILDTPVNDISEIR